MKKAFYLFPILFFNCVNSSPEKEMESLRDSLKIEKTKRNLEYLKDSINSINLEKNQFNGEKELMEKRAEQVADSIAKEINNRESDPNKFDPKIF
jgi:hypothetical protein